LTRAGAKTVLARAYASSPLRLLTPRNHGDASWVYTTTFGGGMVDGDRVEVRVDAGPGTLAFLGTQSTTKVYRSPRGCGSRLTIDVRDAAAVAVVPDPVVCFAGARYSQRVDVTLAPDASVLILDGYSCGRAARGERWKFACFETRTTIERGGSTFLVDATCLDPAHGGLVERMGHFDVVLSLIAVGPRFAPVRAAMRTSLESPSPDAVVVVSRVGEDGAILRVAANRFERASRILRSCFAALAQILGDDPFARKW
jgi:urease accessory protein